MKIVSNKIIYENEESIALANKFKKYWKRNINNKLGDKFFYIINRHKEEIKKFRGELGLGPKYFESKKQAQDWINKEVNKIEDPTTRIKYIETIIPYRNNGLELIQKEGKEIPIYNKKKKSKETTFQLLLEKRIKEFAAKIGLDNSWHLQFQRYLLFRDKEMLSLTDCGIRVSKKLSSYTKGSPFEGRVILKLSANTRLKDIEFIWGKQIKPLLETLPGFITVPPNKKIQRI